MYKYFLSSLLIVAALSVVAACNNPVGSGNDDDHEDHAEVAGYHLISDDDTLVTVRDSGITGSLTVPLDGMTSTIEVHFTTEDGDPVHAEDLEEAFSLMVEVADEELLDAELTERWAFTLSGLEAGQTTINVILRHGNHDDFPTPAPYIAVMIE